MTKGIMMSDAQQLSEDALERRAFAAKLAPKQAFISPEDNLVMLKGRGSNAPWLGARDTGVAIEAAWQVKDVVKIEIDRSDEDYRFKARVVTVSPKRNHRGMRLQRLYTDGYGHTAAVAILRAAIVVAERTSH